MGTTISVPNKPNGKQQPNNSDHPANNEETKLSRWKSTQPKSALAIPKEKPKTPNLGKKEGVPNARNKDTSRGIVQNGKRRKRNLRPINLRGVSLPLPLPLRTPTKLPKKNQN